MPRKRDHRAIEHSEYHIVLVGQIRGIGRPHVVCSGVDVHRHEGEEADIGLFQAGPLVPGPAEFTDL